MMSTPVGSRPPLQQVEHRQPEEARLPQESAALDVSNVPVPSREAYSASSSHTEPLAESHDVEVLPSIDESRLVARSHNFFTGFQRVKTVSLDRYYCAMICHYINENNIQALENLLVKDSQCLNSSRHIFEALIYAGRDGYIGILCQRNFHEKCIEERAPLIHQAVFFSDKAIVEILISHGFCPNGSNEEGKTPLQIALENRNFDMVDFLISRCKVIVGIDHKENPFFLSIKTGQIESFDLLAKTQPDVFNAYCSGSISFEDGNFLHAAIAFNQFPIFHHLLTKYRSSILPLLTKLNCQHLTPLHLAAKIGFPAFIHAISETKACNIDVQTPASRKTPLHFAVEEGHEECVKWLCYLGANNHFKDNSQKTPIEYTRNPHVISFLDGISRSHGTIEKPVFLVEPPKVLVLQGGGARGLAYVGAISALEELGCLDKLEKVSGTSAGAITATMIAFGKTSEEINGLLNDELVDILLDSPNEFQGIVKHLLDSFDPDNSKLTSYLKSFKSTVDVLRNNRFVDMLSALSVYQGVQSTVPQSKAMCILASINLICRYFIDIKGRRVGRGFSEHQSNPLNLIKGALTGVCEGKKFREWIDNLIEEKTHIKDCTFGELKNLIRSGNTQLKHLDLVVTNISDRGLGPVKITSDFDTDDYPYKDLVISDAVRASMSIPGVYKPHTFHYKAAGGNRVQMGGAHYIDGGVLQNFPFQDYNEKYGSRVLGLSLVSPEIQLEDPKNLIEKLIAASKDLLLKDNKVLNLVSLYFNAESILSPTSEDPRIIPINDQGHSTLNFRLMDPANRAGIKLIESAKGDVKNFLKSHVKQTPIYLEEPKSLVAYKNLRSAQIDEENRGSIQRFNSQGIVTNFLASLYFSSPPTPLESTEDAIFRGLFSRVFLGDLVVIHQGTYPLELRDTLVKVLKVFNQLHPKETYDSVKAFAHSIEHEPEELALLDTKVSKLLDFSYGTETMEGSLVVASIKRALGEVIALKELADRDTALTKMSGELQETKVDADKFETLAGSQAEQNRDLKEVNKQLETELRRIMGESQKASSSNARTLNDWRVFHPDNSLERISSRREFLLKRQLTILEDLSKPDRKTINIPSLGDYVDVVQDIHDKKRALERLNEQFKDQVKFEEQALLMRIQQMFGIQNVESLLFSAVFANRIEELNRIFNQFRNDLKDIKFGRPHDGPLRGTLQRKSPFIVPPGRSSKEGLNRLLRDFLYDRLNGQTEPFLKHLHGKLLAWMEHPEIPKQHFSDVFYSPNIFLFEMDELFTKLPELFHKYEVHLDTSKNLRDKEQGVWGAKTLEDKLIEIIIPVLIREWIDINKRRLNDFIQSTQGNHLSLEHKRLYEGQRKQMALLSQGLLRVFKTFKEKPILGKEYESGTTTLDHAQLFKKELISLKKIVRVHPNLDACFLANDQIIEMIREMFFLLLSEEAACVSPSKKEYPKNEEMERSIQEELTESERLLNELKDYVDRSPLFKIPKKR